MNFFQSNLFNIKICYFENFKNSLHNFAHNFLPPIYHHPLYTCVCPSLKKMYCLQRAFFNDLTTIVINDVSANVTKHFCNLLFAISYIFCIYKHCLLFLLSTYLNLYDLTSTQYILISNSEDASTPAVVLHIKYLIIISKLLTYSLLSSTTPPLKYLLLFRLVQLIPPVPAPVIERKFDRCAIKLSTKYN